MNPVLLDLLTALAKWGVTVFFTWLTAKHVITAPEGDRFATAIISHLAMWIAMGSPLAWIIWGKIKARQKLMMALSMPEGSTENEVKAAIKAGEPTPTVWTPPNTIPGVPEVKP